MSAITPASRQLVQILSRAENAGVELYGPDLHRWPARMVDAVAVVRIESKRVEHALFNRKD